MKSWSRVKYGNIYRGCNLSWSDLKLKYKKDQRIDIHQMLDINDSLWDINSQIWI